MTRSISNEVMVWSAEGGHEEVVRLCWELGTTNLVASDFQTIERTNRAKSSLDQNSTVLK